MNMFEFTEKWYGYHLPKTLTLDFFKFAASSTALVKQITDAPIKVDAQSTSAYTDGETIYIPAIYFSKEFHQTFNIQSFQTGASAITIVNGSMIHEALHISLTECDMRKAVEGNSKAKALINRSGFQTTLNLVEDLFIENYGQFAYSRIFPFVEGKNRLFFSLESFQERLAKFKESGDQTSLLNVLLSKKNTDLDSHEDWLEFKQFTSLLDEAKNFEMAKSDRVDLAVRIYELFEDEDVQSSLGFKPNEEFNQEVAVSVTTLSESNDDFCEIMAKMSSSLNLIKNTFDKEVEKLELNDVETIESKFDRIPDLKFELVEPFRNSMKASSGFREFANSFRYLYEEKHTLGRPSTSGTRVVKQRLHRIITDSKVLAYHDRKSIKRGKPKVILLLDASGSMNGSLWESCSLAMLGVYESLQKAGISVAAYAHTSRRDGWEHVPIVYGISAFNMPLGKSRLSVVTGDYAKRFASLNRIALLENFDGFAIKFVSKLFPSTPGSNILIVFSDGLPSGGKAYNGHEAVEHTKAIVDQVRKEGVSVLSISLTKHVMNSNNDIYGKYNIPAFDGKLEKSLQSVVLSLIGETRNG